MNSVNKKPRQLLTHKTSGNNSSSSSVEPGDLSFAALLEATRIVESNSDIDDSREDLTYQTLKERETERLGTEKYFELRDVWSVYIRKFVWFMLGFQLFLTITIGLGWLNFKDYPVFINLVIGQNFAQIIGMGVIVAKFLFSKRS